MQIIMNMYIDFSTVERTCYACPTIYEWSDLKGNNYYFRLRHGYWRICYEDMCGNDTLIVSGEADEFGCYDFDDVKRYALNEGLFIKSKEEWC